MARAGFPVRPACAGSKRCIGRETLFLRSCLSMGGRVTCCVRSADGIRDFFTSSSSCWVYIAGLAMSLRAFLGQRPQQSFPAFVDERDIIKVDNAGALVLTARVSSSRLFSPR